MNSILRSVCVVAVVCCIGCGVRLLWLWSRERDLRVYETRMDAEFSANRAMIAALRKGRPAVVSPASSMAMAPPGATAPTKPARAVHSTSGTTNMDQGHQIRQVLLRMPEYAPFLRSELRRRTMREYGDWFAQLDVSPERLEAIKQLIGYSEGTKQDAFEAAKAAGYRMGTMEHSELLRGYAQEVETRLRQGLTPEEYASYRNFEAAKGWTNSELPQFEAYLGERAAPALTRDQKRVLSEAYVAARRWKPAGDKPPVAVLYRLQNEQIGIAAGHALDPVQRDALVGYISFINRRSQIMGQLLNPKDPDGIIMTPGMATR